MRVEPVNIAPAAAVAPAERSRAAAGAEQPPAAQFPRTAAPEDKRREASPDIEKALVKLGDELKPYDISLRFRRDEESGQTVIDLVNQTTGEKLQQIPTEASLHLSKVLGRLQGIVLSRLA
jgi:flagellar protein FlaG